MKTPNISTLSEYLSYLNYIRNGAPNLTVEELTFLKHATWETYDILFIKQLEKEQKNLNK